MTHWSLKLSLQAPSIHSQFSLASELIMKLGEEETQWRLQVPPYLRFAAWSLSFC